MKETSMNKKITRAVWLLTALAMLLSRSNMDSEAEK